MATYQIQGLHWISDDLEDGYVLVEAGGGRNPRFYMSLETYLAVARCRGAVTRLVDTLYEARGIFLLPRAVIEPEAASDLRLGLSMVEPEASEHCAFQPCILLATVERPEGFSLCAHHDSLMSDWDDLVA